MFATKHDGWSPWDSPVLDPLSWRTSPTSSENSCILGINLVFVMERWDLISLEYVLDSREGWRSYAPNYSSALQMRNSKSNQTAEAVFENSHELISSSWFQSCLRVGLRPAWCVFVGRCEILPATNHWSLTLEIMQVSSWFQSFWVLSSEQLSSSPLSQAGFLRWLSLPKNVLYNINNNKKNGRWFRNFFLSFKSCDSIWFPGRLATNLFTMFHSKIGWMYFKGSKML